MPEHDDTTPVSLRDLSARLVFEDVVAAMDGAQLAEWLGPEKVAALLAHTLEKPALSEAMTSVLDARLAAPLWTRMDKLHRVITTGECSFAFEMALERTQNERYFNRIVIHVMPPSGSCVLSIMTGCRNDEDALFSHVNVNTAAELARAFRQCTRSGVTADELAAVHPALVRLLLARADARRRSFQSTVVRL
jgi:hypothetical protein